MPTATWTSRLRSGSAHWDLDLAVEVRLCPLGSGARGGGPAVPTGIWTARRGGGVRRRRRTALIKSNNPHLAGGEQHMHEQVGIGVFSNKHRSFNRRRHHVICDHLQASCRKAQMPEFKIWPCASMDLPQRSRKVGNWHKST